MIGAPRGHVFALLWPEKLRSESEVPPRKLYDFESSLVPLSLEILIQNSIPLRRLPSMAACLAPERDRVVGFALDVRDRLTTRRADQAGVFRCARVRLRGETRYRLRGHRKRREPPQAATASHMRSIVSRNGRTRRCAWRETSLLIRASRSVCLISKASYPTTGKGYGGV